MQSKSAELTKVYKPKKKADGKIIEAYLKQHKRVLVNFSYLEVNDAKAVLDYLCGTAYAYEGDVQKVGGNVFEIVIKDDCL